MLNVFKQALKSLFPNLIAAYHNRSLKKIYRGYKIKETKYGFKFCGMAEMLSGDFEREEVGLIRNLLGNAEVFIDVGANIGYYTCIARSLGKHVVAIEPLVENLHQLYNNLLMNNWDDVEVLPLGFSDRPGIATLYGGTTGASLVERWAGSSELLKRPIPLSTMDMVLGRSRFAGRKCVIKVDVEGAEYKLLRGAEEILTMEPAPVWIVEICCDENQPHGLNENFQLTFELFWQNGYEASVADSTLRNISYEDVKRWTVNRKTDFGYINYLFRKNL